MDDSKLGLEDSISLAESPRDDCSEEECNDEDEISRAGCGSVVILYSTP